MKIIGHFFKGGVWGAAIGCLFCFISFYLLTSTFRNDFYISATSYAILGFSIGSVYSLSRFFVLEKCNLLNINRLLCDSAIGLISAVLGCLPFVTLFLYEINQKQEMRKVGIGMQELINQRMYDFSLYIAG